jgi:ABC-type multidrug transport system ATPase subunit
MDELEAERWLEIFGLESSRAFEELSGDPRGLLSMAALLARRPQAMLFHTMGLSPIGRDQVLKTTFDHVGDSVGIYCQTHVYTQGRFLLEELEFTFAQTIQVAQRSTPATARAAG